MDSEVRDVLKLTLKYADEIPMCRDTWGKLDDSLTDALRTWIVNAGAHWQLILEAVLARDSGNAVCAEGLVAVAAWDQSGGHYPTAVDLYQDALEVYHETAGVAMYSDHDYSKPESWAESRALCRIETMVYADE